MKKTDDGHNKDLKFRTVRNVFLVYLFTAAATGRYEIFAAICAAFPFIIPVIFTEKSMTSAETAVRSVLYGILGCTASVLFMLITKSYSVSSWLVPGAYSMFACFGYLILQKRLSLHSQTVMKCIITVSVCLLAFV